MLSDAEAIHFQTFGFVVLRNVVDGAALANEFDSAMRDGVRRKFELEFQRDSRDVAVKGSRIPMMCERTPLSLSLLDKFTSIAATLLGTKVLPVRALGTLYVAPTDWHADHLRPEIRSIGFMCYLESANSENGALRVIPGSHLGEFSTRVPDYLCSASFEGLSLVDRIRQVPGYAVETEPGDVLILNERVHHANLGGRSRRRQWRCDYVADPTNSEQESLIRKYLFSQFPVVDSGYDVDLFPNYGMHWLSSGRSYVDRLRELGAYTAAAAEEAFIRSKASGCTEVRPQKALYKT